ncbi:MAG: LPXTG-motif cell wall anchor domain protein [Mycobacterium sp.]|nr:LPXTG-motif cell wall anchor domain protein [Mycobacterium sp.]
MPVRRPRLSARVAAVLQSRRLARRAVVAGVAAALVAGATPFVLSAGALTSGTALLAEDFTHATAANSQFVTGGTAFTPCLTASTDATQSGVVGCASGALGVPAGGDADGSGALRLTDNGKSQAGFVTYNKALPTKAGLDITFQSYQYYKSTTDPADGISFFLTDGAYNLTSVGPAGGSLGYNFKAATSSTNNGTTTTTPAVSGLSHGLVGVGLDVYGNYAYESNDPSCPAITNPATGNATYAKAVGVRGPGNGTTGYCLLGTPQVVSGGFDVPAATSRTSAGVLQTVHIVVDPPGNASPKITVSLNGTQVTQVPQPAELASTPTFKFGWAASTGGSTEIHEINALQVSTVTPLPPEIHLSGPGSSTTLIAGTSTTLSFTPTVVDSAGPEGQPVTVTATAPAGVTLGTPSGTGYSGCTTDGTVASCTYLPGTPIAPGTVLPTVTVPVTGSSTGSGSLVTTVSSGDNNGGSLSTVTVPVTVTPAAAAASAATTASASQTDSTLTFGVPTPNGTPPFQYTIASGTAQIDPVTGVVAQAVAGGTSGVLSSTYTVTDTSGQTSPAAPITVTVRPVAHDVSGGTDNHTPVTLAAPAAPVGTGPFSYALSSTPPPSQGTATIDGTTGRVTFTPADGVSSTAQFGYTVTDGQHIGSDPAAVTVTVTPTAAGPVAVAGALDADGAATLSTTPAAPAGTGPFTYAVSGAQPAGGTGSVGATTGTLTFVAAQATSGTSTFHYTATDAGGRTSAPQQVTATVAPYLPPVSGSGTAAAPVVLPAAAPVGTGPFSYAVAGLPAGVTATIAQATGVVTVDPHGASGVFTGTITATDTHGIASAGVALTARVAPVAGDASATATASATPAGVAVPLPAPTGTGPYAYALTATPPPADGTAALAGSTVTLTPAAGFSGHLTARYTVTDPAGTTSAPATVDLRVVPSAAPASLQFPSGGTAADYLPAPTGSGPLTYALTTTPVAGSLALHDDGGYSAAAGTDVSGSFTATYTVTDPAGLTSAPATVTITVVPVAGPVTGGTTAGHAVTLPVPDPAGTGPFSYALSTPPATGNGALAQDATTGALTLTPAAGRSGTVTAAYRVTGADGIASDPAAVTITVSPVAGAVLAGTTALDADGAAGITLIPAAATGTGPFHYALAGGQPAGGTVTVDAATGAVRFAAATGVSGVADAAYTVTDGAGTTSAPQPVRITVLPFTAVAPADTVEGMPVTLELPATRGTGPFTYGLAGAPSAGGALVTPATGSIRYTPAAGFSGIATLRLVVTDGAAGTSPAAVVTVRVHPAALPVAGAEGAAHGEGTAGDPLIGTPPAPHGTGPFQYALVGSSVGGAATIDGVTGRITFVAAIEFSGTGVVRYRVIDGSGLASEAAPATFVVHPVATPAPVAGTATSQVVQGGTVRVTLPTPSGRGPFTYQLLSSPPEAQGHLTLSTTTGEVTFAAAPGYVGRATFSYQVTDAAGLTSAATSAFIDVAAAPAVAAVLPHTGSDTALLLRLAAGLLVGGTVALLGAGAWRRRAVAGR